MPLLLLACVVGFATGWVGGAARRRLAITLWMLTPGTLFLVKSVVERGLDGIVAGMLWTLVITTPWGLSALLGFGLAAVGQGLADED